MLLAYLIFVFLYLLFDTVYRIVKKIMYSRKIKNLLLNIGTKEKLLYTGEKDLLNTLALLFCKKGYKVKITDLCGEYVNGLILNDVVFVELWKNSPGHLLEIETAVKLSRCMQKAGIYRGMLITTGDFKNNTKLYCHKYVIECINGDMLLDMFKEARECQVIVKAKKSGMAG